VAVAQPGDTLTYTLNISNVGNQDATGVQVTDTLPANTVFISASDSGTEAGGVVTWPNFDLAAGSAVTRTVTVQVDNPLPAGVHSITNTADVADDNANGPDPTPENNSDDDTDNIDAAPDLVIIKDDGGVTVVPGSVLVYTLTYQNVGNQDSTGVVITETVPDYTSFNAGSSTFGWSCSNGDPPGTVCTFNIGDLAAGGASATVDFGLTVNGPPIAAGADQIENTASIADDGANGADQNPADNSDDDDTPVDAVPDLRITKDDGLDTVAPGTTLTYTLTISNVGNQGATGVEVTDTIPANTSFVSASDGGTESGGVVTWPLFDLAVGPNMTRTVTIQVDDPFPIGVDTIVNSAHVEDDGANGPDPTPGDNDDTDTDNVVTIVSPDLTKLLQATNEGSTADPDVTIGEILTYEIRMTIPPGTMANMTLTDVLDRGLAFMACESITPSSPAVTTTRGDFSTVCSNPIVSEVPSGSADPADQGRQVVFDFGDVDNSGTSDESLIMRYTVVALDNAGNQQGVNLDNDVQWQWNGGVLSAAAGPVTIVEPTLSLTKRASPTTALPGATIIFTLRVEQTAESDAGAFDLVLDDSVPSDLTYIPGSLTWNGVGLAPDSLDDTGAPDLRVIWHSFPLGSNSEIEFQAILGYLRPGRSVTNSAFLEWSTLPGDVSTAQSGYNTLSTERFYDPGDPVNIYSVSAEAAVRVPELPATGFAPGRHTPLPDFAAKNLYQNLGDLWLEIPALNLRVTIVGVPTNSEGWDLTWLWDQAGYLEGTAFPTLPGNSALTGHIYLADGSPGPFVNLADLYWGKELVLHAYDRRYIYQVRQVRRVLPENLSVLQHEKYDWLTLITCEGFDETSDSYLRRVVVRGVLIRVEGQE
jgi:LPXTG-site transpeptidase (sortase) family protein